LKQQKLDSVLVQRSKCSKEKTQIINSLVLNVIVKGQRPLSLVEDESVKDLLAYLEPGYTLPGRKHFTSAVQTKYATVREKLSSMLSEVEYISITADTWTSLATESYLTVTVHYVSQEWELKSHVLGTLLLEERHTGEHLSTWIVEMLSKFGVSPSKVVAVVHDNASNMVSAINILKSTYGIESIRCAAHTLQLAVNSTLSQDNTVKSTLTCARKLVEFFNRSSVAHSSLRQQQEKMNLNPLNLVQDVPTRWGSSFHMCERLVALRLPLTMVMANPAIIEKSKRQQLELRSEQWAVLETICELLQPFATLTKYLEAQSYVSVSAVQPLIKGIIGAMNVAADDSDYAKSFKEAAVDELLSRFENLFSPLPSDVSAVPVALRALALDIRFHKLKSLAGRQARFIRLSIENELVQEQVTDVVPSANGSNTSSTQTVASQNVSVGNLLSYLQEQGHSDDDEDVASEGNWFTPGAVRRQMANFVAQSQQSHDVDTLEWWKANESRYKALSGAARKYLAIPATSAPSERVFSVAGNICNRRRASLSSDNLDALVFLNANADLLS
jgi:hypothetical protein